jgi:alkylation response protein AidB-like acyl-CoA dehydrogenase
VLATGHGSERLAEDSAFRKAGPRWLKKNVPAWRKDRSGDSLEYDDPKRITRAKEWQRKLYGAGYVAMGWPKEYGGQGLDVMKQTIVNEEMVRASAPTIIGMMGINMVGPTLMMHGTDEQKREYLPKILRADELWCQGYSEPGSGSDLASLKTRAAIDGDHFVVNGQKIWTSGAQYADRMFCLVRTDPEAPKHRGISYVLIDMKSPGITGASARADDGDRGFNEVFFEDVRVPRENLVGKLHDGWTVANSTLFHERNMLASTTRTQILFESMLKRAKAEKRGGKPATKDPDRPPAPRRPGDPRRDDEARRLPPAHRHAAEAPARHQRVGEQARHLRAEPPDRPRRARGDGRGRLAHEEGQGRPRRRHLADGLHVRARPHHRRRHRADPEEHHRRARAGTAARAAAGVTVHRESRPP